MSTAFTPETCPSAQYHGSPFRYCPDCSWIEPASLPEADANEDCCEKAVAYEPGFPDIEYRTRALSFAISLGPSEFGSPADIVVTAAKFEQYLREGEPKPSSL